MAVNQTGARPWAARVTGHSAGGRVRLQTLVVIRWIALAGQTIAILLIHYGFGFALPLGLVGGAVAVSAAVNIVLTAHYPSATRLSDGEAASTLAFDTLQLGVLLFLTGGVQNPFSILVLAPVTISATTLSLRSTAFLGVLTFASLTFLAFFHMPLPWSAGGLELSHVYVFGIWTALALGMVFISVYAWRIAEESRRMSDALAETQMALARAQQLSALGGLAAAAAHELGTPLGTITLVAKELSREIPPGSPLADDVNLLISQSARCRDILARLSRSPDEDQSLPFRQMRLTTLAEMSARPYGRAGIEVAVEVDGANAGETAANDQPVVVHNSEIVQGIGNLIENAVDFAGARVTITVRWTADEVGIDVSDDGPGFSQGILGALGEPYVSTRRDSDGMGLGVFIAKTLLERTGARVSFGNQRDGGARVAIAWPRAILEAKAISPPRRRRRLRTSEGDDGWRRSDRPGRIGTRGPLPLDRR